VLTPAGQAEPESGSQVTLSIEDNVTFGYSRGYNVFSIFIVDIWNQRRSNV
jgi:hypothetical protein